MQLIFWLKVEFCLEISFIYTVQNSLHKEPSIQCVIDRKTIKSYINEIQICFDKNLELIGKYVENNVVFLITDCEPTNPIHRIKHGLNTNCRKKQYRILQMSLLAILISIIIIIYTTRNLENMYQKLTVGNIKNVIFRKNNIGCYRNIVKKYATLNLLV